MRNASKLKRRSQVQWEVMVMEKVLSFDWYQKISKVIRTSVLCLLWCTSWCTLWDFLDYSETSLCISMLEIHSVGPVYFSWYVRMREGLYIYNSFTFSDSGKQSTGGSKISLWYYAREKLFFNVLITITNN